MSDNTTTGQQQKNNTTTTEQPDSLIIDIPGLKDLKDINDIEAVKIALQKERERTDALEKEIKKAKKESEKVQKKAIIEQLERIGIDTTDLETKELSTLQELAVILQRSGQDIIIKQDTEKKETLRDLVTVKDPKTGERVPEWRFK